MIFREVGRGKERETSHMHPNWRSNPQLRYVPWPGIEPESFCEQDDSPANQPTLTRAIVFVLKFILLDINIATLAFFFHFHLQKLCFFHSIIIFVKENQSIRSTYYLLYAFLHIFYYFWKIYEMKIRWLLPKLHQGMEGKGVKRKMIIFLLYLSLWVYRAFQICVLSEPPFCVSLNTRHRDWYTLHFPSNTIAKQYSPLPSK